MSLKVIFALVLLEAGLSVGDSDWGYQGNNKPQRWGLSYPGCYGQRQSPIVIENFLKTTGPILSWSGYDDYPASMTLTNNGHTVALTSTGVSPRITTDDGTTYQLENVHFHWGRSNEEGSEHTIKKKRFAMEMHAVHTKINGSSPNEILVTATFFEVKLSNGSEGLNKLVEGLHHVIKAKTSTKIAPFPWSELLDQFTSDFFWYEGSLTVPSCSEVVTFLIQRVPSTISDKQINVFRELLGNDGDTLSGNFRPLQNRNGRYVYFVG